MVSQPFQTKVLHNFFILLNSPKVFDADISNGEVYLYEAVIH